MASSSSIAFLLALTDPRVEKEARPFDHPQLFVPVDGTAPMLNVRFPVWGAAAWNAWLEAQARAGVFKEYPATGASGGAALPSFITSLSNGGYSNFDEETGKGPFQEDE